MALSPDRYISINTKTLILITALSAYIVISLVSVYSQFQQFGVINSFLDGEYISQAEAEAGDAFVGTMAIIQGIIFFNCSVWFLVWKYRAYKNLHYLETGCLEYSPIWAVSSYFIPIIWFYKPYQVMREIWNESNTDSYEDDRFYFLMPAWWALFIVDIIFARIRLHGYSNIESLQQLKNGLIIAVISEVIGILSSVVLISLVRVIYLKQQRSKARLDLKQDEAISAVVA